MNQALRGDGRRDVTAWNHVRAILLLPLMNTVFIPAALLAVFGRIGLGSAAPITEALVSAAALILIGAGLAMVSRAIVLFVRHARGTLAPWDPSQVLLVEDIYRFSRNPMKSGLFIILIGECLLFRSPALVVWTLSFIVVNVLYIRWFEERGLQARFGDAYERYCAAVPRWIGRARSDRGLTARMEPQP